MSQLTHGPFTHLFVVEGVERFSGLHIEALRDKVRR